MNVNLQLNTDYQNFYSKLSSAYVKSIENIGKHNSIYIKPTNNREFIGCIIYAYPRGGSPFGGIAIFNRHAGKILVAGNDITIEQLDATSYIDGYLEISGLVMYTHVIVLGSCHFELELPTS